MHHLIVGYQHFLYVLNVIYDLFKEPVPKNGNLLTTDTKYQLLTVTFPKYCCQTLFVQCPVLRAATEQKTGAGHCQKQRLSLLIRG